MNYQSMMKPLLAAGALVIVLVAFGVPIGYLVLPLLLVACPLLMFFMMRGGMNHSGGADRSSDGDANRTHEHH